MVPPQVPSGVGVVAVWVGIALLNVEDTGLEVEEAMIVEEAMVDEELGQTSVVNVPRRTDLIQVE